MMIWPLLTLVLAEGLKKSQGPPLCDGLPYRLASQGTEIQPENATPHHLFQGRFMDQALWLHSAGRQPQSHWSVTEFLNSDLQGWAMLCALAASYEGSGTSQVSKGPLIANSSLLAFRSSF